jgi:UDPglucose 6-dehydrogenase
MKIGIIGLGFVGSSVYNYFAADNYLLVCDNKKEIGTDILSIVQHEPELIFVCVDTPTDYETGKQDPVNLCTVLYTLSEYKYEGIVVIKSTVLFSNIKKYLSDLRIVMNPEFLTQDNNYKDFNNQKTIIIGTDNIGNVSTVISAYKSSSLYNEEMEFEIVSIKEAIDIKYYHNIYHAYKVLFWNFVAQNTDFNHRKIYKLYKKLVPEGNEMAQVAADGKLGYGGACFPKDVAAYDYDYNHMLTKFMIDYNKELRK